MSDLYTTIESMLLAKPELRSTKSRDRVLWNVYHRYGHLDENGKLSLQEFEQAPSIESIMRRLREVKKAHDWKDDDAKRLENEYHKEHGNPAYTPNRESVATSAISIDPVIEPIEPQEDTKIPSEEGSGGNKTWKREHERPRVDPAHARAMIEKAKQEYEQAKNNGDPIISALTKDEQVSTVELAKQHGMRVDE